MDETDTIKNDFTTHRGLFQFKIMVFRHCNTPATFQKLMEKVLGNLSFDKCLCYLDDIIVFGKDFENALGKDYVRYVQICIFCLQNQSFRKSSKNKVKDSLKVGNEGVKCYHHSDVIM